MTTGTPLFLEGSRSDTVALVISGRIKVFSSAADGTEVVTRSTIGTAVSSLAAEWRELNEGRRALHEASQHQRAAASPPTRQSHRWAATRTDGTLQDSTLYASW